jgi:hypothetical protein
MVPRLAIGTDELKRISQMLRDETQEKSANGMIDPVFKVNPLGGASCTFVAEDGKKIEVSECHQILSPVQRKEQSNRACRLLFRSPEAPELFRHLDDTLSEALKCSWPSKVDAAETVERASHILERLPGHPSPMIVEPDFEPYQDMRASHLVKSDITRTWENLKVTTLIDRNTIRLALFIAVHRSESSTTVPHADLTLDYVNMVAELFETADVLSDSEPCKTTRRHWFLIKAFLWTTWHRSVLLHLSSRLGTFLQLGTTYFNTIENLDFIGVSTLTKYAPDQITPKSMCKWAFELIKTDRVSAVLDLRLLCQRYAAFSQKTKAQPRCLKLHHGAIQCGGSFPHACERFTRMKVEDQSSHASSCCGGCIRMHWDESSFRCISGPRAVLAHHSEKDGIKYCQASNKTMTISHVWSHGQGGRPEVHGSGLNYCLHLRYCLIAHRHGCDSYWIDAACIPEDKELRLEAIDQINDIFKDSELTLICDKDIMAVDTANLTIEVEETLLSVLLVSDWNVRAWTLLEAMRGKSNLHLLCKDDRTVPLRALVEDVNREGSVEIATIFVTARHLLPTRRVKEVKLRHEYTESEWRRVQGFLLPEEAACLLGRRYASRGREDEIMIWALLCGETTYKTAEEFWTGRRNLDYILEGTTMMVSERVVHTGFLVSSAPRITKRHGLGWAPCQPSIAYKTVNRMHQAFDVYDGLDTVMGAYSNRGLEAHWLVHEFSGLGWALNIRLKNWLSVISGRTPSRLDKIVLKWLGRFRRGAILIPALNSYFWTTSLMTDVARLIVVTEDGSRRHAVVMIGSDDGEHWNWLGVQGLDDRAMNSLEFVKRKILIV